MGRRRGFLTAQWRHLAMLNYEIDPMVLAPYVPWGTCLDLFDGKAYLSMVGFLFLDTRLLGMPIPGHQNFEEVNLRFYVRRESGGELRRGVVFIKEIVPRRAITMVARRLYNENYMTLPMRHKITSQPAAEYQWKAAGRWNALAIQGQGSPFLTAAGSREEFITEHYWGYSAQHDGGTIEYEVQHPCWNIWRAEQAHLDCDAENLYGKEFAAVLARPASSALIAEGSEITVFWGERL